MVLDDCNIDDDSIRFCRDWALGRGDDDGVRLADSLLQMTRTQRKRVVNVADRG